MRLILLALVPACVTSTSAPGTGGITTPSGDPGRAGPDEPAPETALEAAHRDAYGNLVGPGGSLQMGNMSCDAAHDHCVRAGTWFMTNPDSMYDDATPAFEFEGAFYAWQDSRDPYVGVAHRTVAASTGNVTVGAAVVVFDTSGGLPYSESNAQTQAWHFGTVGKVEADSLALVDREGTVPLAGVRVVVETR